MSGLTRRGFMKFAGAAAAGAGAVAVAGNCPLCTGNVASASEVASDSSSEFEKLAAEDVPELISSADETWGMSDTHQLTEHARGAWNLHRAVIDATFAGGWQNDTHPWSPDRQEFFRYPLAFGSYAIPSLLMVDSSEYQNAADTLRKSICLMKEHAAWNDWQRNEWGLDPVWHGNIMYKGHLNLMYGLYQMITGSQEFAAEYQGLTANIVNDYQVDYDSAGFVGVECEYDQYFTPCNSVGMMSLVIYDKLYGTDYESEYSRPTFEFLKEHLTDKETNMPYFRWHPSHESPETCLIGDWWSLGMLHYWDNAWYETAYANTKERFLTDLFDGKACYSKAALWTEGASTDIEQRMWPFYLMFCCKEFGDKETWEKISRFFQMKYDMYVEDDGLLRYHDYTDEETDYEAYFFLGDIHQGWQKVLDYDWEAFRQQFAQ